MRVCVVTDQSACCESVTCPFNRQMDSTSGSRLPVLDPCNLIAFNIKPVTG